MRQQSSIHIALARLQEFANLPHGWVMGREVPPSAQTCATAKHLLMLLFARGLKVNVFPADNNELIVTAYKKDECICIGVQETYYISCSKEIGIGQEYEVEEYFDYSDDIFKTGTPLGASLRDITTIINIFAKDVLCRSSEFSTTTNMTMTQNGLGHMLLCHYTMEYSYLMSIAHRKIQEQCVPIFVNTIPQYMGTRPYSGGLNNHGYPMAALWQRHPVQQAIYATET